MNTKYLQELEELKTKMEKAEIFASKFPIFEKIILDGKITGESSYIKFGERYKELYLNWGINYVHYDSKTNRKVSNYGLDHDIVLFNLYFNTVSLYDSHSKYGLEELGNNKGVFFFDRCNSTFYVYPEHIESFLDLANEWYNNAIKEIKFEKAKIDNEILLKRIEENNKIINNK